MPYHRDPLPEILSTISMLRTSLNELEELVYRELTAARDRGDELAAWADPYASDGRAICNYSDD